ncbi:MAG: glycoside hydrolase family 3 protein [Oscillospiraceae bacterium]|nr:glycoside hydrolase family 3 protein [Oscillospiraceae bacterium]
MSIIETANKFIGKTVNMVTSAVSQTSNKKDKTKYPEIEGIKEACRKAAEESFVLLKNEGNVLPIKSENTVSIFGRVQLDTFFVGYGSGGDVNAHYTVNFIDGIRNNGNIKLNEELADLYKKWVKANPVDNGYWGHWPMCYKEMHINEGIAKRAALISDTAVVFIGRAAGEDRENTLTKGSFYLTDEEENMLWCVRKYFKRMAVILNIGNIIDFSWAEKYDIPCIGLCWQGGMETGNAVANILFGNAVPSGKLTDTIALSYESYPSSENFGNKKKNHYEEDIFVGYRYFETFKPEAVLFEFGRGLSYSDFSYEISGFTENEENIELNVKIANLGEYKAKTTIQIYYGVNKNDIPVPKMQLCAYKKTNELEPNETQDISFTIEKKNLACYDDIGISGRKSAWVLQKGEYEFYAGLSVRDVKKAGLFTQNEHKTVFETEQTSAPKSSENLMRLTPIFTSEGVYISYEPAPADENNLRVEILSHIPEGIAINENRESSLIDVYNKKISLDDFVSTLTLDELEAITRGDYIMNSPLGARGNAGVFGGVLESMRNRDILPITCTDGPSGIRLAASSSLLPSGTALACTYNPELIKEVYTLLGKEMADRGSDVLLAPGMNIHRDPLCGRNFEYFSEDPLISGLSAAAVITGLKEAGVSGCPKHFACNNQETHRTKNNSVLSERALREIYLKGFEICVKTAHPEAIMTSYNKINGVWGHYNYDLVTRILRKEWGYTGMVMTDWWMQKSASPEFPNMKNQAYRVRAGVDVLMPGGERTGKKVPDGTLLETYGEEDGITLGEMQNAAKHVLNFILNSKKFIKKAEEKQNEGNEL